MKGLVHTTRLTRIAQPSQNPFANIIRLFPGLLVIHQRDVHNRRARRPVGLHIPPQKFLQKPGLSHTARPGEKDTAALCQSLKARLAVHNFPLYRQAAGQIRTVLLAKALQAPAAALPDRTVGDSLSVDSADQLLKFQAQLVHGLPALPSQYVKPSHHDPNRLPDRGQRLLREDLQVPRETFPRPPAHDLLLRRPPSGQNAEKYRAHRVQVRGRADLGNLPQTDLRRGVTFLFTEKETLRSLRPHLPHTVVVDQQRPVFQHQNIVRAYIQVEGPMAVEAFQPVQNPHHPLRSLLKAVGAALLQHFLQCSAPVDREHRVKGAVCLIRI